MLLILSIHHTVLYTLSTLFRVFSEDRAGSRRDRQSAAADRRCMRNGIACPPPARKEFPMAELATRRLGNAPATDWQPKTVQEVSQLFL